MKKDSWRLQFSKMQKPEMLNLEKQNKDYCIINGNKTEGNACSTIIDNMENKQ